MPKNVVEINNLTSFERLKKKISENQSHEHPHDAFRPLVQGR